MDIYALGEQLVFLLQEVPGDFSLVPAGKRRRLLPCGSLMGGLARGAKSDQVVMYCRQDQNSSRSFGGLSMPKKEDGRPWRSRSRFTKAVKEETQLPIKWSAWLRMYRSI